MGDPGLHTVRHGIGSQVKTLVSCRCCLRPTWTGRLLCTAMPCPWLFVAFRVGVLDGDQA